MTDLKQRLVLLLICAFVVMGPTHASAFDAGEGAVHWTNGSGTPIHPDVRTDFQWVWVANPETNAPAIVPRLRLWVELPDGVVLEGGRASPGAEVIREPGAPPFELRARHLFALQMTTAHSKADLVWTDFKGTHSEVRLMVDLSFTQPTYVLDRSCQSFGIEYVRTTAQPRYFFNAARCVENFDGSVRMDLFHSPDGRWDGSTLAKLKDEHPGWHQFEFRLARGPTAEPEHLGKFVISGAATEVVMRPKLSESRVRYQLGAGLSYANYVEGPIGIRLNQAGLTPKASVTFELVPRKVDLELGAYATLFSLWRSPTDLNSAHFLGINLRGGLKLPVATNHAQWRVLAGWYYWAMDTGHSAYGISRLMGPQIFAQFSKSLHGRNFFSLTAKFAPLSRGINDYRFHNHEKAIGGGFFFRNEDGIKFWGFTLDAANVMYQDTTNSNSMQTTTVTVGWALGL